MFTGIVSDIGVVKEAVETAGGLRITITCGLAEKDLAVGASVACAGACLTVVEAGEGWFAAELSPETLSRTAPHHWHSRAKINLEAALRVGDALGGHFVTGHVDGLAKLADIKAAGDSHILMLEAPQNLAKFIAAKGSVTLDGVSLTVNMIEKQQFQVNIIPHTWAITTMHERKSGDMLNLEIDMIARYLARMQEQA